MKRLKYCTGITNLAAAAFFCAISNAIAADKQEVAPSVLEESVRALQRSNDELRDEVVRLNDAIKKLVPKYSVMAFKGNTCPTGWSPFIPAMGRVILGAGVGSGLTDRRLGDVGGSEKHVLSIDEMPSHYHSGVTSHGNSMSYRAVHGAGQGIFNNHVTGFSSAGGVSHHDRNDSVWPLAAHTHNFQTNSVGQGLAHNIMQPYIALNYCIKD